MGAGAGAMVGAGVEAASQEEIEAAFAGLDPETRAQLAAGLKGAEADVRGSQQTPDDVLGFWFGAGAWGTSKMSSAAKFSDQNPLWWGKVPDFSRSLNSEEAAAVDKSCQAFAELVRANGRGELSSGAWAEPAGLYARMLLADQLSRNCFRGTSEAFSFDEKAVEMARLIFQQELHKTYELVHFYFLMTPGQHSEDPKDHQMNAKLLEFMSEKFGAENKAVQTLKKSCDDHKEIVDRFGRYPHRNHALGRESTEEEAKWLADYDKLPSWAKSQLGSRRPSRSHTPVQQD